MPCPLFGQEQVCAFVASGQASGQVGLSGDYKAFRVIDSSPLVYEVCNIDGSSHARWRQKQAPTYDFHMSILYSVVVNGKVYSLWDVPRQDQIAYFDLETEEWSPSIMGPLSSIGNNNNVDRLPNNYINCNNLWLAELNGCLVVISITVFSTLNLWFLMDFEKGIWIKQHSMQVNLSAQLSIYYLQPLSVLNDGRIVTYLEFFTSLRIYDPSTNNYTEVKMDPCVTVGLYTGSLLRARTTHLQEASV
jgi:hypothetical protein